MLLAPSTLVLLALGGFVGGLLGGLTGLGGGVVFAPVLLYLLPRLGVQDAALVPLVTGTSLFCTLLSVTSSAWAQHRRGAVDVRVALAVGAVATASLYATKALVTTQPWYTPRVFEVFFAIVLVLAATRMLLAGQEPTGAPLRTPARLGAIGAATGVLSAAGGVGGGVVLVPGYNRLVRLPLVTASGTSNATIVLSSAVGVLLFALTPARGAVPPFTVGSVSGAVGLALALPAMAGAQWGVALAHRLPVKTLRRVFAGVVLALAAKMALG